MRTAYRATLTVEHQPGCNATPVAVSLTAINIQVGERVQTAVEAMCLGCGPCNIVDVAANYNTATVEP